eukprot:363966-Chlamydomonas_euryale.AAC.11
MGQEQTHITRGQEQAHIARGSKIQSAARVAASAAHTAGHGGRVWRTQQDTVEECGAHSRTRSKSVAHTAGRGGRVWRAQQDTDVVEECGEHLPQRRGALHHEDHPAADDLRRRHGAVAAAATAAVLVHRMASTDGHLVAQPAVRGVHLGHRAQRAGACDQRAGSSRLGFARTAAARVAQRAERVAAPAPHGRR